MANIVLKTFAAGDEGQGTVTPQDDALIYQNAVSVNGIFGGATVTLTGANTLHVASGFGIICGRFFEINESDISVQLSSSGTLSGRLKIHLDLNNADNPIEIVTETGATLPALSGDSNININGGAFDMELCTFSVNELTISSLVNTFPIIDNTSKQVRRKTAYAVNDFVLCQSASDALIFVCTTAGTTAIQEPSAYQTVTDGNTVTDGTAVFKAVSVSGQITKLSKTEVLASNAQQMIAPILTSLVAPSGGLESGDQFIYNGLLYKATAAIAQGGTIVINGNAVLADSVTEQIGDINVDLVNRVKYISQSFTGVTSSKKLKIRRNGGTDVYFVIIRGNNGESYYTALISGYSGGSDRNVVTQLAKGANITSAGFKTNDTSDTTFEISFGSNIASNLNVVICSLYNSAYVYTITLD